MTKLKNLVYVGQVFYELTVINDSLIYKNGKYYILCSCSCGNVKEIRKDCLFDKREGKRIKSCGCRVNINSTVKKRRPESMYNVLYRSCKTGAKSRGLEFSILREDHKNIITKNCCYCGAKPSVFQLIGKRKALVGVPVPYNGVDRVNSNAGYVIENCVPCCERCNKMKMDSSVDDFMDQILKIHNHQNTLRGIV